MKVRDARTCTYDVRIRLRDQSKGIDDMHFCRLFLDVSEVREDGGKAFTEAPLELLSI